MAGSTSPLSVRLKKMFTASVPKSKHAAIIDQLDKLHIAHEYLSPEIVLEAARSKSSPLHCCFDWSDSSAAEKWRLHQARNVIRSVEIVYESGPVRAYQNVTVEYSDDSTQLEYRDTEQLMSDPDDRAQVLECALIELRRFRAKYAALNELAKVFEELDKL